jgi:hypothetical protein
MHLTFGNRCGHVCAAPTLDPTRPIPVGRGGYPRILAVAAERIEAFYSAPEVLPSLALNATSSQKRSERREALVRLLKAILKFTDLVSLTVAVRDAQAALCNISIGTLAKHADLEPRRAERALSDLATAGFLFIVQQRVRLPEGGFRSQPAIKRLSPSLFSAFGLAVALKLERTKAQKRHSPAPKADDVSSPPSKFPRPGQQQDFPFSHEQSFTFALRNLTAGFFRNFHDPNVHPPQQQRDTERQRRWNAVAIALREQHPDWPADEIRAAADKAIAS